MGGDTTPAAADPPAPRPHRPLQFDRRRGAQPLTGRTIPRRREDIPVDARQRLDILCRLFVAFVLLQAPHQFGTRILFVFLDTGGPRQQHARLDLGQHGGHHQILRRQLQIDRLHQFHVLHVLMRNLGNRYVEDLQILPADQVEQQVERPLERLEEHLQRLRRDVEVLRQLHQRRPLHDGERHLLLLRIVDLYRFRHRLFRHWYIP